MNKLFATTLLAAMFAVPATFAQNASTDAQAQAPASKAAAQSNADPSAMQSAPAASARAQKFEARMVQRRVAKMTALLALTPAQQTQVTGILTNAAQSRTGERGTMKQARAQMRTAIEANDSASIEQASNTIGNMAAENAATRAKTAAAIYQILTPDQKAKAGQLADLFGGNGKRHHRQAAA